MVASINPNLCSFWGTGECYLCWALPSPVGRIFHPLGALSSCCAHCLKQETRDCCVGVSHSAEFISWGWAAAIWAQQLLRNPATIIKETCVYSPEYILVVYWEWFMLQNLIEDVQCCYRCMWAELTSFHLASEVNEVLGEFVHELVLFLLELSHMIYRSPYWLLFGFWVPTQVQTYVFPYIFI